MSIEINVKGMSREVKKKNNLHRIELRRSVAQYLDLVRLNSAEEQIIANTTGTLNPYNASKKQPSTPGRLTSRTGKLRWTLRQKLAQNPEIYWSGMKRKIAKLDLPVLALTVRDKGPKGVLTHVEGSLKVKSTGKISMSGRMSNRGSKSVGWMPKENSGSMRMRYVWNYAALKGTGRRNFIDPAAKATLRKLNHIFDTNVSTNWSK